MSEIKQVIVIRKDLKMRRGKEIAQGAHASLAFLTRRLLHQYTVKSLRIRPTIYENFERLSIKLSLEEILWITNSYKKICVTVNSSEELYELHRLATEANLESHIITDNGLTEFKNVHTVTALAIGPDYNEKIDAITGNLPLY